MKTKLFLSTSIVLIMILTNACKEYNTKTKINADGSCERTIIVSGDSSEVADPKLLLFPVPVDASWKIERRKDSTEKNKFYYTATKQFADINLLNDEYKNESKIGIKVKFEKKFRWFFTYYNYEETYKAYFPFKIIPLKTFLSSDEYKMFLNDDTTKAFRKRLDDFATENYIQYFFNVMITAAEKHSIKDLSKDYLLSKKEYFKDNIDKEGNDKAALLSFLEKTYKTKSIREIKPEIEKAYDEITNKMEEMTRADGTYQNEISMSGIVLSTNSKSINGSTVSWKVDSKRFCFEDFTMTVQSRIINVWTFFVSGVIVLGAIVLLLLPKFKKKN